MLFIKALWLITALGCIGFMQSAATAEVSQITFHFYGAEDCPPCMAFKRKGLPVVEQSARASGYMIAANIISRTVNVPKPGAFGATDPILRLAAEQMSVVYPPIFFVTRGSEVDSIHGHDWRAAMARAELLAARPTN